MILAAHQPNYIPWNGYFHKMSLADRFVFADDVQFSTQGYTNRTRIKTAGGQQWLTVPVLTRGKGPQLLKDVRIDNSRNWRKKHWRTLYVNYKHSIYFDYYADFFDQLYQKEWPFMVDLNLEIIEYFRRMLHIDVPVQRSSEMDLRSDINLRLIDMARQCDCSNYLSGKGGSTCYLDESLFESAGIALKYHQYNAPEYRQLFADFIPRLSTIDMIFNEGPESALKLKENVRQRLLEGQPSATMSDDWI